MELTAPVLKYVAKVLPSGDFQQDVFVRLLSIAAPEFETADDCEKWINIVIQNLRGNYKMKEFGRARLMEENDAEIRNMYGYDDTVDDPLDIILADEFEDRVLRSLSSLEKDIYGLYQSGESYPMISETLKMSQEAIRKHVSRIKVKFNVKIQ